MSNGIYAAAAGMTAEQTQLDAIANDIANANTTGYKSERVGFENLLPATEDGVDIGTGAAVVDAGPLMVQGALEPSSNPLAVAVDGSGFLQVRMPGGGTGLTRDGDLQLDAAGQLTTSTGELLVPPITVPHGTQPSQVTIASDGTVSVGSTTVGRIQLVDVPAPNGLLAAGQSTYVATAASGAPAPASGSALRQGMLEQSNVNLAQEMAQMISTQNGYSILSKVISTQDQLRQIANELRSS